MAVQVMQENLLVGAKFYKRNWRTFKGQKCSN